MPPADSEEFAIQTRMLGATGLRPTAMGLGGGGFSRLGLGSGGEHNAEAVVQAALDAGVNLFDTAEAYGTEQAIGNAIRNADRSRLILSTKLSYRLGDRLKTPAEVEASLDASLRRLGSDYVDVYHVHGVSDEDYPGVVESVLPVLLRLKSSGKARFLGITEAFSQDTGHRMLGRAVQDDCWDVMMVGFNLLNTSARDLVLSRTRAKGIGTLCMFAVRQALTSPERLEAYLRLQAREGCAGERALQAVPLVWELLAGGECASLAEAAYRFCRDEPGIDCVLSGTGSAEHLRQNVAAIQRPPLPERWVARFGALFDGLATLSGQ